MRRKKREKKKEEKKKRKEKRREKKKKEEKQGINIWKIYRTCRRKAQGHERSQFLGVKTNN